MSASTEKTETEKTITVRVSAEQGLWIDMEAARLHESISTVMRMLIREKMEAEKQQLVEA